MCCLACGQKSHVLFNWLGMFAAPCNHFWCQGPKNAEMDLLMTHLGHFWSQGPKMLKLCFSE
jgi:hypothetical protein